MIFSLFLIFTGAAVIATLALFARQALLVAYIALGALLGPSALNLVSDQAIIADIANIGIIFLLFLLGLNLEPDELKKLFSETFVVTSVSSMLFAITGFLIATAFGYSRVDALMSGAAMMFSSTIIALKLLPTSALHQQRMGELIVSILLLQDMLAISILLILQGFADSTSVAWDSLRALIGLPLLAVAAFYFSRIVLVRLFMRFDRIQEYVFLVAVGWCLGIAEAATLLGLSHEIGAFVAGVSLAANPIARFLAESLKPLRDFFLVMFFFALGAGFDFSALPAVFLPAICLALVAVFFKPRVFAFLLRRSPAHRQKSGTASETGARLGHISEFSLLIVLVAESLSVLSERGAAMIQSATITSFVISSFWIVRKYPTPIATSNELRRD